MIEDIKTNNRDIELDTVSFEKVVLMIIVVFYHSCCIYGTSIWGGINSYRQSSYVDIFLSWMNSFHIQSFTFLSGYLFYYNKYEKRKYSCSKNVIKKRFKRLIIPYFFALLWVIPSAILALKMPLKEILVNYILAAAPSQLWFLIMLFGEYLLFSIISDKCIKTPRISSIGFLIVGYIAVFLGDYIPIGLFQIKKY